MEYDTAGGESVGSAVHLHSESGKAKERRHWTLNLIGVLAILALCYLGEVVLVTVLVSVLIAFILAPAVDLLMRLHIPRGVAAAIVVLLLVTAAGATVYYSYNQTANFLQELPKYTTRIREEVMRVTKPAESLSELTSPEQGKGVLNVHATSSWSDIVSRGFGSMSQTVLAVSFTPFLVYFMLTWQQHVRSATVMLFPLENRHTAYVTLGLISAMIRSFMVGNVLIGLLLGAVSSLLFWGLGLPFAFLVGFISGFLSLVPYMGILLAMAPPFFVGIGHISSGDVFWIVFIVLALHVIAMNILYPKFLGNRVKLNPLAVTLSALLWAWLWGAVGLVLAIPMTASIKIFFDHVESLKPYGAWLGE